jgi:predicted  nucleic acid-binding Zn-ribbon protein
MNAAAKVIEEIVKKQVHLEITPVRDDIKDLKTELVSVNKKIDKLTDIVTDFAGQMRANEEERIVISGRLSNTVDRVEKLEVAVFGAIAE